MKYKYLLFIAIFTAGALFSSCADKEPEDSEINFFAGMENLNKDTSYAMGVTIGADILNYILSSGLIPYLDEFMLGLNDVMWGKDSRMDLYEAYDLFNSEVGAMMDEQVEYFQQQETAFLAENAKRPEITITPSGLQYHAVTVGTGPKPRETDVVLVDYEGSLIDGTTFDSSYERGYPLEIGVNEVIEGWTEGLQLMNTGSQFIFYIPSNLAYGSSGAGSIPPYNTLIFIVELHEILN